MGPIHLRPTFTVPRSVHHLNSVSHVVNCNTIWDRVLGSDPGIGRLSILASLATEHRRLVLVIIHDLLYILGEWCFIGLVSDQDWNE